MTLLFFLAVVVLLAFPTVNLYASLTYLFCEIAKEGPRSRPGASDGDRKGGTGSNG